MNEYSISDYGIFSDAITTTNDCSNSVSTCKDGVNNCKTIISDESTFMGPMQEKCVTALTGLDTDCSSIISNLETMSNYLINTSATYQKGDKDAQNTLETATN